MPQEINISIEDIQHAEKILLPGGKHFDQERLDFIYNFETIDLQAVPGSGKTTALLAKLLILETKLPFESNRGVLILSHTNKAVDEIKERIGKHCPKLFSYPNFIGTIQSFVDQFLAIPYFTNKFEIKPFRIDNEIYNESIQKLANFNWGNYTQQERRNARYYCNANNLATKYRWRKRDENIILLNSLNGNELNISKPRRGRNWQDFSDTEKRKIKEWLIELKKRVLKSGVLHFDDAYVLADTYISKFPLIKNIIQERFQYVFVDEVQDMDTHQYSLLETIFYDDGVSKSVYQRIGDINQAIYSGEVHTDDVWGFRGTPLTINGSHRLSANIAELVNCFTLNNEGGFQIEGKNENSNLKPHLIVYDADRIKEVIPKFSQVIRGYIDSEDITISDKSKFKVIGWVKEKEGDKIGITDYSEEFKPQSTSLKVDYDNLYTYLHNFNKEKRTLEPIRKNILNALIKILRMENIKNFENRYFSKKQLLYYLSESYEDEYINLKRNLFDWSIDTIRGKTDEVYNLIKEYIPNLLNVFEKEVIQSKDFIDNGIIQTIEDDITEQLAKDNIVNYNGFDIEVSTVHSVKGQTHTATMYIETFKGQGRSKDTYESQKLCQQYMHNDFDIVNSNDLMKQATKMAYVGFSRPTDLLCVAVCKDRFDSHLSDIDTDRWEIVNI